MRDSELKALVSLIDDPDTEIFKNVRDRILSYRSDIIPYLLDYNQQTSDSIAQKRIQELVHHIQLERIREEIINWTLHNQQDLLEGLIIINRYDHPDLDDTNIRRQIAELKTTVWMELIYEMSPFEKIKLLNNILFKEFGLSGNTANYHAPQNSFLSSVLASKKGNPISLSCIYSIIAQKLDIPIYGINLPKHFVAAYAEHKNQPPQFYINVFNKGQIMKRDDIYAFLNDLNLPYEKKYIEPCSNIDIIKRVLRNLMTAYSSTGETQKTKEIQDILNLI